MARPANQRARIVIKYSALKIFARSGSTLIHRDSNSKYPVHFTTLGSWCRAWAASRNPLHAVLFSQATDPLTKCFEVERAHSSDQMVDFAITRTSANNSVCICKNVAINWIGSRPRALPTLQCQQKALETFTTHRLRWRQHHEQWMDLAYPFCYYDKLCR